MLLSIIILSYNTAEITKKCVNSLITNLKKFPDIESEVIIIDNGSNDGTKDTLEKIKNTKIKIIFNKYNTGYPKGNNQALKLATGKYILFLNSDVIVKDVDFADLVDYFNKNKNVGALTVKVKLQDDGIDPASHRGFPTVWNSFCYFLKLEKLFGRIPLIGQYFGGYHLTNLDLSKIHEIDSPTGAFYMSRKDILDKLEGFDETFAMYGEDLDLSFRIKELGYKIIYYPKYEVLHLKHQSGLKSKDEATMKRTKNQFYEAMKIFYKKHYEKKNSQLMNKLVYFFINLKKNFS